jgi:hypothetical protein
MIAARFMELRKRRGLMITLMALTIGFPTLFLVIKLLLHAFVPKSYGPAGGTVPPFSGPGMATVPR